MAKIPVHSVPANSIVRSRLSAPVSAHDVERSGLFEMLRELAFETALHIGECSLRIGLAATTWQLRQAQALLAQAALPGLSGMHPGVPSESEERVVAVALHTGLCLHPNSALATISLHRDGSSGLALDGHHAEALDHLRENGARLVEVEQIAFDAQLPLPAMLAPMVRALSGIVVDVWGTTDIVLTCQPHDVVYYCDILGFARLPSAHRGKRRNGEGVLLHLPTTRIDQLLQTSLPGISIRLAN